MKRVPVTMARRFEPPPPPPIPKRGRTQYPFARFQVGECWLFNGAGLRKVKAAWYDQRSQGIFPREWKWAWAKVTETSCKVWRTE